MDRTWAVWADEDGDMDREEVQSAFLEAEAILHRLGGAMSIVAAREEVEGGEFVPSGVLFRWESFSPAKKRQPPAVVPEPVEEEESDQELVEAA